MVLVAGLMGPAVAAEAHAFSTLKMGIASIPAGRSSTCPRIISWPVTRPATAFPTYAASRSVVVADESANACVTAAVARSLRLRLDFSKRVIPTPATKTVRIKDGRRYEVSSSSVAWA